MGLLKIGSEFHRFLTGTPHSHRRSEFGLNGFDALSVLDVLATERMEHLVQGLEGLRPAGQLRFALRFAAAQAFELSAGPLRCFLRSLRLTELGLENVYRGWAGRRQFDPGSWTFSMSVWIARTKG